MHEQGSKRVKSAKDMPFGGGGEGFSIMLSRMLLALKQYYYKSNETVNFCCFTCAVMSPKLSFLNVVFYIYIMLTCNIACKTIC